MATTNEVQINVRNMNKNLLEIYLVLVRAAKTEPLSEHFESTDIDES